ncbi:MAG: hypothetical protein RBU37_07485 [Myxococcota bacterium]|jgi:hypothetical protein|nr:hypothetical protein [Myxococcota bacterium]
MSHVKLPEAPTQQLLVHGSTLLGFAQACKNLSIVAGSRASSLINAIDLHQLYPFERLRELERLVIESYIDSAPILERVGQEMMLLWYHEGPGKAFVRDGADFLTFQSGSQGYASVVHGPKELVGSFDLLSLDRERGKALVKSTTPFQKDLERGVLLGGISAPKDLDYIDVDNSADPQLFHVTFH